MANWIYLKNLVSGDVRPVNADLVFTVSRQGNKTVLSTTGDSVFLTDESVDAVMKKIADGQ